MIRLQKPVRLAAALLLGATALSPVLAQEAQPPTENSPAPTQTTPLLEETTLAPPVVERPAPVSPAAQASEPVVNTRASGNEPVDAVDPAAEAAPARRAAARQDAQRSRAPAVARARAAAPAPIAAPVEVAPAPAAAPEPTLDVAPPPIPTMTPPIAAEPAAIASPADPAPAAETGIGAGILPWLIAAAIAIAGLILVARRRRTDDRADDVVADAPITAVAGPVETIPVAAAAAPVETGRPWLDLSINPVRAGVGEDAARVEFQLGVENNGSAPARDVRIATWLIDGNAPAPSEMERMLIARPDAAQRFEASIEPGDGQSIDTAVDLPRAGLDDAILPVVAAEARYRLPDGGEGRTTASFAVGVARGEELVLFDVDNPSGLHDGVEARLHGEPRRD